MNKTTQSPIEHTIAEAAPQGCCAVIELAGCCEASEKAACCGPQAATETKSPAACGCR